MQQVAAIRCEGNGAPAVRASHLFRLTHEIELGDHVAACNPETHQSLLRTFTHSCRTSCRSRPISGRCNEAQRQAGRSHGLAKRVNCVLSWLPRGPWRQICVPQRGVFKHSQRNDDRRVREDMKYNGQTNKTLRLPIARESLSAYTAQPYVPFAQKHV